jgi:CTP synthase (UTP-ammonia lyase)
MHMKRAIRTGIIGDYDAARPSHRATDEALSHCARYLGFTLETQWLPTGSLESGVEESLKGFDGFWCAPGSPYRSMAGALNAIRYAREHDVPFIGTCGGFQHAALEYARNVLGAKEARHEEYGPGAADLIITALSCSLVGENRKVFINEDSLAYRVYGQTEITERFNCNFGLNPVYRRKFNESGFSVAGTDENGEARILELRSNRFYIATLFQPQLSSTPENPHRLILAYLGCIRENA